MDLVERTITVRHSYARDTTKGGHADVIPIAAALTAHLAAAIKASPTDLVFPASDGSMLSEDANTERVLRSALARAGLVTGYDHTCRRCKANATPHVERHADATLRHCPRCHMKLWPRPLKSKMPSPVADRLRTSLGFAPVANEHACQKCLRTPRWVARLAGVEPAARGFEGRCSIQLSYRRVRAIVPFSDAPAVAGSGVVCLD